MCLLKELPPVIGKLHVNGIMGYSSQIPWVVSGTLQDNITFGDDVKEDRYNSVLQACALYKVVLAVVTHVCFLCQVMLSIVISPLPV
jgi:ABC-type multidrug transport system fused ATPase/permease subunit